jgi:hypothetical protein
MWCQSPNITMVLPAMHHTLQAILALILGETASLHKGFVGLEDMNRRQQSRHRPQNKCTIPKLELSERNSRWRARFDGFLNATNCTS